MFPTPINYQKDIMIISSKKSHEKSATRIKFIET